MTFQAALFTELSVFSSALTALVGSRIYPVVVAQPELNEPFLPTLMYRLDTRGDEITNDLPVNIKQTTWSFLCMAASYDLAHEVYEALEEKLNGFSGPIGGQASGISVCSSRVGTAFDEFEETEGIYMVDCEYAIAWKKT